MNTVKTLPVEVYRCHFGDCTNGGVSSQCDTLYLIHEKGWMELPDSDPRLVRIHEIHMGRETFYHVRPVNPVKPDDCPMVGPMMGGNFIYDCDSRFPFSYPLPIHDRYETQEQYDAMFD